MKNTRVVLLLFFGIATGVLRAQEVLVKGVVSYVSSQNVYVRFSSTKGIDVGDTLFLEKNGALFPALLVWNKSSVSCVCTKLISEKFEIAQPIVSRKMPVPEKGKPAEQEKQTPRPAIVPDQALEKQPAGKSTARTIKQKPKQNIRSRLSAASYSNFSENRESTRLRYAFSLQGNHLKNSKFSSDVYVVFRHALGEWSAVQNHWQDALKIYSLAAKYEFNASTNLTLGRSINPKLASMGAIDGLQFEKSLGPFFIGAVGGSRPDYLDYSVNPKLVQAGVYVGLASAGTDKRQQSTLGFIEQRNRSAVDRRFIYFQHTNDVLPNLNVFTSIEGDLYQHVHNETTNRLSLTNLFASLRYKFSKKLNATLSYDNRRNIIYYESYKSYIDQLIDQETRQGMRLGIHYRPAKWLNWGSNASWRFQKSNINNAKNLNTYLNFNHIPLVRASAAITANFLQTNYLHSNMYGLRLTKDVFKGKLNLEVNYRRVDYSFPLFGYSTHQNIIGGSLSWQVWNKLNLYVFAEQTFDSQNNNYLLLNTKIMQRF